MKWGKGRETSLAVWLLRLPSSTAGGMGSSLVGELRSHIKKNSPNHPPTRHRMSVKLVVISNRIHMMSYI